MELVNLGRAGVKVSRLCLGCMTYGSSKWRPWVLDEDAARPFFRKAPRELAKKHHPSANSARSRSR